jgi:hypothetical protein
MLSSSKTKQCGQSRFGLSYFPPPDHTTRQANGKLKKVPRNDKAIICRYCGGMFKYPYEGMMIENNGFSISFYCGSSWQWASSYEFIWMPAKKNWYLVKE